MEEIQRYKSRKWEGLGSEALKEAEGFIEDAEIKTARKRENARAVEIDSERERGEREREWERGREGRGRGRWGVNGRLLGI